MPDVVVFVLIIAALGSLMPDTGVDSSDLWG
jgi:hypothetical protein